MANLDGIREALIILMTDDQEFIDSIELSTSAVKMVRVRFDKWRAALDAVLEPYPKQPRIFSRALKEGLFKANQTCSICGQFISDLAVAGKPSLDVPPGTLNSILKQAGLKKEK